MLCHKRGCGAGSRAWGNMGRELRVRGCEFYGVEKLVNHPFRIHCYAGFLRRGDGSGYR